MDKNIFKAVSVMIFTRATAVVMLLVLCFPCVVHGQEGQDSQDQDSQGQDSQGQDSQGQDSQESSNAIENRPFSDGQLSDGQLVVVVGAAGTEEYGQEFGEWAERWREVAKKSGMNFIQIGLTASTDDENDRDSLRSALESAAKSDSDRPFWLVLIGHGTFARGVAKFNLRGPDVSAADLAKWFGGMKRPIVIANCASASGPFVNRLTGPGRVIVTATRSGVEQNYARFGGFLAEAINSAQSDLDHDGEVSIHEAFLAASAGVRTFYATQDRIVTEHALIDDNGDGKGTPATMFRGVRPSKRAKDGLAVDGAKASRVTMNPSGTRLPFTPDELALREQLERKIDLLRAKAGEADPQEFDQELLPLMVQLAQIYQAAQKRAAETSP